MKPVGTPFSLGSCEKEYWVFAMQTEGVIRNYISNDGWLVLTGEITIALSGVRCDLLLGKFAQLNTISAINLLADDVDLLLDGEV